MTLCGAAAKGVPYTQLCKHSLDYHWTRRSTQYQDLCFSEPQAIRHKRNSVSCTGKPRPREASATSVGTGTSGTGTQAVWPLVQRRVLGGGVLLGGISGHLPIFHSPHPGPMVPAEKPAVSLALPHELLFRFSLCHGVQRFCQDVYLPS